MRFEEIATPAQKRQKQSEEVAAQRRAEGAAEATPGTAGGNPWGKVGLVAKETAAAGQGGPLEQHRSEAGGSGSNRDPYRIHTENRFQAFDQTLDQAMDQGLDQTEEAPTLGKEMAPAAPPPETTIGPLANVGGPTEEEMHEAISIDEAMDQVTTGPLADALPTSYYLPPTYLLPN